MKNLWAKAALTEASKQGGGRHGKSHGKTEGKI